MTVGRPNSQFKRACVVAAWLSVMTGAGCLAQDIPTSPKGSGLSYGAVLTVDALSDVSGGLRQGTWGQGNLDLTAAWQGPSGWEAFGYVIVDEHGGFTARYAGDVQGVSNIDAPSGVRLLEAWTKYTSADQRLVSTFGIINLNGVFDTQPVGSVFLNSSHGIGPDISQSGPSIFPYAGLGFVEEWRPTDTLQFRFGVFDGVPYNPDHTTAFTSLKLSSVEGAHVIVEAEKDFTGGFIKVGYWRYSVASDRLDGDGKGYRSGTYAQGGLRLTREPGDSDQGLSGWLRLGLADKTVMNLAQYGGGGLVYTGPFVGRDHDVVGVSLANASFGSDYRRLNPASDRSETTIELTYQAQIKSGIILQPDVQLIHHPSGASDIDDAVVIGARLRFELAS